MNSCRNLVKKLAKNNEERIMKKIVLNINTLFLIIVGLLYIFKITLTNDRALQIVFGIVGFISLSIDIKYRMFNNKS